MAATTNLLYRASIEGADKVKAEIAAIGDAEDKAFNRAARAAEQKAKRAEESERRATAARQDAARAAEKLEALAAGRGAAYEAEARAARNAAAASAAHSTALVKANASAGQLRAGSQQLSYQIGDVAAQFASGTPVVTIFAQQIGQTIQAVQLMTNTSKGFIGFLGGPWGAAITGGTALLATLVSGLFESEKASGSAKNAGLDFANSQTDIAKLVDLATGRIIVQNQVLRENAILKRQENIGQAIGRIRDIREQVSERINAAAVTGKRWVLDEIPMRGGIGPVLRNTYDRDLMTLTNSGGIRDWDRALGELVKKRPELRGLRVEVSNLAAEAENLYGAGKRSGAEIDLLRGTSGALDRYNALTGTVKDLIARTARDGGSGNSGGGGAGLAARGAAAGSITEGADPLRLAYSAIDMRAVSEAISSVSKDISAGFAKQNDAALGRFDYDATRSEEKSRARGEQERGLLLARRELELVTASNAERDRQLSRLQLIFQLQEQFPDLSEAELAARLRINDEIEATTLKTRMLRDAWEEVKATGANFIDTVLNPQNWDDWGDLGKRVLQDLYNDFIRLAAINPLKNMLFGEGLPTLGGISNLLGGGGGKGLAPGKGTIDILKEILPFGVKLPGFAVGTAYASGGMALLGENGPEIADLPAGTRVTPAAETRRLLAANDRAPAMTFVANIDARGADAAGLARVESEVRILRETLPAMAVAAVQDARQRHVGR